MSMHLFLNKKKIPLEIFFKNIWGKIIDTPKSNRQSQCKLICSLNTITIIHHYAEKQRALNTKETDDCCPEQVR